MSSPLEALQTDLHAARQTLLATLDALTEADWETPVFSEDSTWTVMDILRHLADSQNSMTRLMIKIRDTGEGVPDDFDLARWNASRVSKARVKTRAELIAQLDRDQASLFAFMATLDEADWQKQGRHGTGKMMSIAQICAIIAGHERLHAADVNRTLQA